MGKLNSEKTVYEVIRVINSVPLFLEDHFFRLLKSVEIQDIAFEMEYPEFKLKSSELINSNNYREGNIKFMYSVAGTESRWTFDYIPHNYPTTADYQDGVNTGLLYAERDNPNAKVIQSKLRDQADQMITDQKLYEVLLADQHGRITEGSRSNVFFVRGEVFYTAHESKILVGITRQKVIECLKNLNFQLVEEAVKEDEINRFDAVFLTGTSPKVLPVRSIGDQEFSTRHDGVVKLMEAYNQMITHYIQNEKGFTKNH